MRGLRGLDDRVVPRAAARLRALVDAVGRRRRAVRTTASAVVAPVRSGGVGALQRLDDRFTRRGPLAVVREVPQVGLVAVAAVFLAGAGVALARGGDDGPRGASTSVSASSRVLGPEVGADVQAYVETSREAAVERARDRPDAEHLALVSLSEYRTPEAVAELLGGLEVQRAYLRVPADDPSEVLSAEVSDLVADLAPLYAATAARKAQDQREFARLAATIDATSAEQREFKEFYELSARIAGREAEAYRNGCACVFSVVVRSTAATLAELPALQGVRAVELAAAGVTLQELRIRPLGPEATTTVEAGADPRPGGG